jgi:predicted AAA+ superfamily ATPase
MFQRTLKLAKNQSFFLFGARQTGKSTLLRDQLDPKTTYTIDLLDPEQEDRFSRNPKELEHRLAALSKRPAWVVIDEVQRAPRLLDLVHRQIESTGQKFALTGSSARKLKRGAANLLAGRAIVRHLHPITHREAGSEFDLDRVLGFGSLPKVFSLDGDERIAFLRSYALTYLKEEIAAEQVLRRLDPFRNFLEIAAQTNGTILNHSNIARDVGISYKTVQSYFEVLEDTLIGFSLPAFHESLRKRQTQHPKFYFFDLGVKRALERTLDVGLSPRTYGYGNAFEHFLIAEIRRLADYAGKDWRYSYLRTVQDVEIDLVIDRPGEPRVFLEIKSATDVDEKDCTNLAKLQAESKKPVVASLASRSEVAKKIGKIHCLPWKEAIAMIGI